MRVLGQALLLAGALAAPAAHSACDPPGVGEPVAVDQVSDGDTVRLRDGRRVRLIGIDAPERGRDGRRPEPHAERARDHLLALAGGSLRLHPGLDDTDRHGRTLGHLVRADGRNLQVALLEAGLAVVIAVPPNLRLLECYREAEGRARAAGRGVWRDGAFGPLPRRGLPEQSRRFVESLPGREVIVRGYLFGDARRTHLTIGHPSLIELR